MSCSIVVHAQQFNECATPYNIPDALRNIDINALNSSNSFANVLKVYVYICRNSDGTNPAATVANIDSELDSMRLYYSNANICFLLTGVGYIDNTTLNTNMNINNASLLSQLTAYTAPGNMVMYIHLNLNDGAGTNFCGNAYNIPNTYVSVTSGCFGWRKSTSHEMGHDLGLYHTFHGNPGVETDGSSCQENINGSNGTTCGDFVQDTPADPYKLAGASVNGSCVYNGTATDPNGATNFTPQTNNIMSYWANSNCTRNLLTVNQNSRMNASIATTPSLLTRTAPTNLTLPSQTISNGIVTEAAVSSLSAGTGNYILNGTTTGSIQSKMVILTPGFLASVAGSGNIKIAAINLCQ